MTKRTKVWVYRNLSRRTGRPLYSIMRSGRVVLRRHRVLLQDVRFVVRPAGRQRVLREQRKHVHAFAVGYLCGPKGAYGIDHNDKRGLPVPIHYSPYTFGHFFTNYFGQVGEKVDGCGALLLNEQGMSACMVR